MVDDPRYSASRGTSDIELDLPEDTRRASAPRPQARTPSAKETAPPSPGELTEARRLADYIRPESWIDCVSLALTVGSRRRTLRKQLETADKNMAKAAEQVDGATIEYGRSLHARAMEVDLSAFKNEVARIDHAVLHDQQMSQRRRSKEMREAAMQRIHTAQRQLAVAALDRGTEKADPEGLAKFRESLSTFEKHEREVRLRGLGIDMFDAAAVKRGRTIILVALGLLLAAGLLAWLRVTLG